MKIESDPTQVSPRWICFPRGCSSDVNDLDISAQGLPQAVFTAQVLFPRCFRALDGVRSALGLDTRSSSFSPCSNRHSMVLCRMILVTSSSASTLSMGPVSPRFWYLLRYHAPRAAWWMVAGDRLATLSCRAAWRIHLVSSPARQSPPGQIFTVHYDHPRKTVISHIEVAQIFSIFDRSSAAFR